MYTYTRPELTNNSNTSFTGYMIDEVAAIKSFDYGSIYRSKQFNEAMKYFDSEDTMTRNILLSVNEADQNVIDNEPYSALFIDGQSVYERILANFEKVARFPFLMCFEIDPSLEKPLIELMNKYLADKYDFSFSFTQDINKKIRFLTIGVNK